MAPVWRAIRRPTFNLCVAVVVGIAVSPHGAAADLDDDDAKAKETCRELWTGIGLPEYVRDDGREVRVVCHTKYVLSHNDDTKTPDWVLERITSSQVKKNFRRPKGQKFQEDPALPDDKRATDIDYKGSGFDRGHQAASDDFSAKLEWMKESFFLSNIVPQVGVGFNQSIWARLEDLVRDVVRSRGQLYVITGPIYRPENGGTISIPAKGNACGNPIKLDPPKKELICGSKKDCTAGVTVPAGLFKIIYDAELGRANAFVMPNINHTDAKKFKDPVEYLKKFRTTVQVVEEHTGLRFLSDLSTRQRRPRVEQCAAMMLH